MNVYYIYVYLDSRKPGNFNYESYHFDFEPFYVGKGQGKRLYEHLKCYDKSYKTNKIKAILNEDLEPIIIKYKENLLECHAFDLEIDMIKTIGRIDLGTCPLTNHTDGGIGMINLSEESKRKISKANKGKIHPMYGKHHFEETKQKLKAAWIRRKLNKEIING